MKHVHRQAATATRTPPPTLHQYVTYTHSQVERTKSRIMASSNTVLEALNLPSIAQFKPRCDGAGIWSCCELVWISALSNYCTCWTVCSLGRPSCSVVLATMLSGVDRDRDRITRFSHPPKHTCVHVQRRSVDVASYCDEDDRKGSRTRAGRH